MVTQRDRRHRATVRSVDPAERRFGWLLSVITFVCIVAALFVLGQATAKGDALSGKADAFVARKAASGVRSGWSEVVVRLDGALTAEREADVRSLGGYIYRRLPIVESVAVRVPTRNLAALAELSFVKRVSADERIVKNDEFTVESSGAGLCYEYGGLTGKNITVAVIDSGVEEHKDLSRSKADRVIAHQDFVSAEPIMVWDDETNSWKRIYDPCGHGTHVAGIVAGDGSASSGNRYTRTFCGIARRANIVDVRVLDDQGMGSVSNAIAGIQWVIAHKRDYNIRVLNLSLGHPVGESYTTDPLCQAVEAAWKSGIVVVCAAGNNGRLQGMPTSGMDNEGYGTAYGSIQSPGNSPYVITVGAAKSMDGNRWHDRIATYSSRGPSRLDMVLKPDIIAPGNQVISLAASKTYLGAKFDSTNMVPFSYYTRNPRTVHESNKYFKLSGTSMASPVVAGAVALMLEVFPNLSPDTVKARLMLSADKGYSTDPCTWGAGYLNLPAAFYCRYVATEYALSPQLMQDSSGNVTITALGDVTGTRAVWGNFFAPNFRAIWGNGTLAGSNILQSSRAVWGNSVWADRACWGTDSGCVDLTGIAINGE